MTWPITMPLLTVTSVAKLMPSGAAPIAYAIHLRPSVGTLIHESNSVIRRDIVLAAVTNTGIISGTVPWLNHANLSPTILHYHVTRIINGSKHDEFDWEPTGVEAGGVVDLDTVVPLTGDPGTPVTVGPPGYIHTAAALDTEVTTLDANAASAVRVQQDARIAPGVSLPAATGVDDTTAIQAVLTAHAGKRIVGRPGSAYKISAPLVLSTGTTLDMATCSVTLLAGSNCRMIQNYALGGSGARDTDVHITGGYWDRGANGGALNGLHSIVLHRADRVSVTDLRYTATGACKYSIYLCDVTEGLVERCDIISTSDGVHVTGPASRITVRDIVGTTDDDVVSFTGRDYPNYELTAGGGDISDVVVERANHRGSGTANVVKLLSGALKTLSNVVVRDVTGSPAISSISILSDTNEASTTGGTIKGIVLDGISGSPTGAMVYVSHPDVQCLIVRNVIISGADIVRVVTFTTSGTTVTEAIIDGVTSVVPYTGTVIHLGTGAAVTRLQVSSVCVQQTSNTGNIVGSSGAIGSLHMRGIVQTLGFAAVFIAGGTCPVVSIDGLHSTAEQGVALSAAIPCEVHLGAVTAVPTSRLVGVYTGGASLTLRGSRIAGTATTHLYRTATQTIRAVGADVRCDVSTLTPVAGDIAFNTNAALGCGAGVVISNGTLWKHLYTGATT